MSCACFRDRVEFLDSTGLQTLLTAHAQAQHDNWELTIIPGPPAVQRLFEISCTIDRLPFHDRQRTRRDPIDADSRRAVSPDTPAPR